MEGHEKRKFPRLPLNVGIKYEIGEPAPSSIKATKTRNISEGGICIIALEKLPVGSTLDLDFFLPDDKKIIKAKGKVAWVNEFSVGNDANKAYDLGIEFVQINKSDTQKINKYVNLQLMPEKT